MSHTKFLPEAASAVAGIAFAILMFLALSGVDPLSEATDAELVAWWSDSGNVRDTYMSMYFMLAAVPCFLVFLAGLRGRLAAIEGEPAAATSIVFAAGLCFAAMTLVADASRGTVAHSVRFGGEPLPGPDTLRYLTSFTTVVFAMIAMPAAAMMIGAASWVIVRTRAMPVWLAVAGAVVVVGTVALVLAGIGPFASPLIQLWVIAAGIELWRTRDAKAPEPRHEARLTRTGDVVTP